MLPYRWHKSVSLMDNADVCLSNYLTNLMHKMFHNKSYFMPLHVSSKCAYHQEVKIALHSLWYPTPIGVMIPEAV